MKRAVIITGLCRSGGAAVAQVCHALGFAMGRTFMAPIAPDYRMDWEDAELTACLAFGVEPLDWSGYVAKRLAHAQGFGFHSIGFKSSLLSIGDALDHLRWVCDHTDLETVVVRVERPDGDIERSIGRQPGADVMRRWNEQIRAAGPVPRDHTVLYPSLVADPAGEVRALARRLGVDDPVAIERATARVAKPCS